MAYFYIILILLLAFIAWRYFIKPSNTKNWRLDQTKLAWANITNKQIKIYNIRHCTYRNKKDFDVSYYNRVFDLSCIKTLDFVYQPFHQYPLAAHTFLSFGFADGQHVCVSIEARRTKKKEYSSILGLLNYFELIYIVADEADILKLRTAHHRDKVFVFPIKAKKQKIQDLFLDMLKQINKLKDRPEFYHTFKNTCSNNLIKHFNAALKTRLPISWQVLFPAYIDRYLYKYDLINTDLALKKARQRFLINDLSDKYHDHPNYSKKIRLK
ncbi:DUF4105 domain-containing protein [Candidatus Parcubacteria bacterium]|nr:DUF4105 domain-containing protein [Candidatus Parcubacteria bacterium]